MRTIILKFSICVLSLWLAALMSCKKDLVSFAEINKPPIANAGLDQTIELPKDSIILNGSASNDLDGIISEWLWTKISGPVSFKIIRPFDSITAVKELITGIYQFELKVTDNNRLNAKDTISIAVDSMITGNHLPITCDTFTGCNLSNLPVVQGTLIQIGTLSVPRIPTAGAAGNKVVFAGGLINFHCGSDGLYFTAASAAVDIYDIVDHSWAKAQLSIPRGGIRTVSCGNKIFFAGGEDGISITYDQVDIYDVVTNTWSVAHLSKPRAYVTTATIGNKVFFAGGYFDAVHPSPSSQWGVSNTVDMYDLSTNQWSATTLSNTATGLCIATTLLDKIYFAGGNQKRIIDIYDNITNTWSTSKLQALWDEIPTNAFTTGSPIASFATEGNIYWAGNINEGIFEVGGECDYIYTGRIERRNAVNGATSITCAPFISSPHVEYRNNEIAFFPTYNSYRNSSRHYSGWGVDSGIPIYNTTTGHWTMVRVNVSNFVALGQDAGTISVNNIIYLGGGAHQFADCVVLTDKVYIINW